MWLVGSIYLITIKHLYKNYDFWGTTNNEWLSARKIARRLRALSFCYKRNRKDRWLWCCHRCELWRWCFVFKFVQVYVILKWAFQEFGVHEDYCLLSKVDTWPSINICLPQGQARFSHGWLKISGSLGYLLNGWTIGGRVHWKSSTRKVTRPSTIPALRGLTLEFPWDPS